MLASAQNYLAWIEYSTIQISHNLYHEAFRCLDISLIVMEEESELIDIVVKNFLYDLFLELERKFSIELIGMKIVASWSLDEVLHMLFTLIKNVFCQGFWLNFSTDIKKVALHISQLMIQDLLNFNRFFKCKYLMVDQREENLASNRDNHQVDHLYCPFTRVTYICVVIAARAISNCRNCGWYQVKRFGINWW